MLKRESLLPLLAAAAVLAALAAALIWLRAPGGGDAPAPLPGVSAAPQDTDDAADEAPGEPAPAEPGASEGDDGPVGYDGPVRTVTVLVDGWSQRTADLSELSVVAVRPDGARVSAGPVRLSPLSAEDVVELAGTEPGIVTRLGARMVRFDVLLDCDASGCFSQRGQVPLDWLAEPSQVPSLGEVYAAWGVEHGVFSAAFEVPEDAGSVSVSAPGLEPVSLRVPEQGSVSVSAAFGTLFELAPTWVEGQGIWEGQPFEAVRAGGIAPEAGLSPVFADGTAFWRGLAAPVPGAAQMHPSVLTMLSSPTFGCNGALCVPGVADVTLETVAAFSGRACPHPQFPEFSGVADGGEALVAASQLVVTVRPGGPVPLIGADIPPAREWAGHVTGGVGPFTGDVPLSSGVTVLRVKQVWLFTGDALSPHIGYFARPEQGAQALSRATWESLSPVLHSCR